MYSLKLNILKGILFINKPANLRKIAFVYGFIFDFNGNIQIFKPSFPYIYRYTMQSLIRGVLYYYSTYVIRKVVPANALYVISLLFIYSMIKNFLKNIAYTANKCIHYNKRKLLSNKSFSNIDNNYVEVYSIQHSESNNEPEITCKNNEPLYVLDSDTDLDNDLDICESDNTDSETSDWNEDSDIPDDVNQEFPEFEYCDNYELV